MARYLTIASDQSTDPHDHDPVRNSRTRYEGDCLADALREADRREEAMIENGGEISHDFPEADAEQFPYQTHYVWENTPDYVTVVYVRDTTK